MQESYAARVCAVVRVCECYVLVSECWVRVWSAVKTLRFADKPRHGVKNSVEGLIAHEVRVPKQGSDSDEFAVELEKLLD